MAQIKLNIPDDRIADLIAAFAKMYNYQETIDGPEGEPIPNPESKSAFAKRHVLQFIRDVYVAAKRDVDVDAVRAAAIAQATAEIATTGVE